MATVSTSHPQTKDSTLAIISLIAAIVGMGLLSPVAIFFGHRARSRIRNQPALYGGKGLATAGLVLGYLGLALILIPIVLLLIVTESSALAPWIYKLF